MEPVVDIRGLTKRFGERVVLRDLDLQVPPGVCFGVLGPNGAGKTTALRAMLGLTPVSDGTIHIFGQPMPAAGRTVRARCGVVPQADNLDPDFTVIENLRVYARYFGLSRVEVEARIQSLLGFVELTDRADSPIATLSGGMKRRLTIARALINQPELIILDEPTTGLDPQVRRMIWARLRALREEGRTLLLTTHYMDEAERLCDQLVIVDHGRVLEHGSPRDLIHRHVEPEVLEVRGAAERTAAVLVDIPDARIEQIGDIHYCYTRDARSLLATLEQHRDLTFLHRPSNLEDVFLKLTGHELRD
jgi:lipooligosaccharide transport system ATP-binding protein